MALPLKIKLEIAVGDNLANSVIETIQNEANTDNIGDGKIFVHDLTDVIRIRTGERGEEAL